MTPDTLAALESGYHFQRLRADAYSTALAQIARMRMDGEGVGDDGEEFVLENDDAVDGLHSCIRLARAALAGV